MNSERGKDFDGQEATITINRPGRPKRWTTDMIQLHVRLEKTHHDRLDKLAHSLSKEGNGHVYKADIARQLIIEFIENELEGKLDESIRRIQRASGTLQRDSFA